MKIYNEIHSEENYGNSVVDIPPQDPQYPLTVFDEIRNVAIQKWNTPFDKCTSNGYRVDIFAQDQGEISKRIIARQIAKIIDTYLTKNVGLNQISYNVMPSENDDSLYHIIMTYEKTLHENRAKFI